MLTVTEIGFLRPISGLPNRRFAGCLQVKFRFGEKCNAIFKPENNLQTLPDSCLPNGAIDWNVLTISGQLSHGINRSSNFKLPFAEASIVGFSVGTKLALFMSKYPFSSSGIFQLGQIIQYFVEF
jgi:hypothetical protein